MALKLQIIIGSTRPGRLGPLIADWVLEELATSEGFVAEIVDLADFGLPVFDEPKHPMLRDYQHEHTKKWSDRVVQADAFVIVTPEYNYNAPASLVNALDYLYYEWNYKPAGIVSYGGGSGGLRAAQSLKLLLTTLKIVPLTEGVGIPHFGKMIIDGKFVPDQIANNALQTMTAELSRWAQALKTIRK